MDSLLGALPLIAFGLGFLLVGNLRPEWGWSRAFLRAAVYFGAYAVVGAELLSLVHGLTSAAVVVLWALPSLGLAFLVLRRVRRPGWRFPRLPRLSAPEALMAILVALVLLTTAAIAYLAPPNTWDSLTYHVARVAHWAQAGSLGHYATGIERQNLMPPGAEIGVLHAYLLAQGDRLANFPQWLAMVACLIAAGALAQLLGATRPGQWLAAVFVATLPMGIAQATSTMTDFVVALWVACVAFEALSLFTERGGRRASIVALGLATGLAILAKPTAFAYLAPFGLLVGYLILRRHGMRSLLAATAVVIVLILAVNAGYLGRNMVTYGHPLGSRGKLETHANEIFDGKMVVSNLLRNASLHAGTPWPPVNDVIFRGVIWIHLKLGIDLTDPRTTVHEGFQVLAPNQDEKRAGNPLHAALALAAAGLLVIAALRGHRETRLALLYLGLVAMTFVLLSSMIKFSVFASRYHLPFFVLLAPVVGYEAGRWKIPWLAAGLAGALALAATAWLLRLDERPLLQDKDGYSVARTPRESLYFMTGHNLEGPYRTITETVRAAACSSVGIMLSGDAAEYPLWPLLGEPGSGTRLEWIVAGTPSARYTDPDFQPCAVICDGSCPADWTEVRGLPVRLDLAGYRLFLSPPQ